jgi:hypothetical protein
MISKSAKIYILIFLAAVAVICGSVYFLKKGRAPSIQIVFPKSGVILKSGTVQMIRWKSENIPGANKISVAIRRISPPPLQEEGQEFDPLIFVNLPDTGSKEWTVSDMYLNGTYVLEIASYASVPVTNPITATSEEFSIQKDETAGLECHDSPKYFAVEKGLSDSVGSDILIKYKTNSGQTFPCAYEAETADFELKNVEAEYFLAFTDNFLILDGGTAPEPRKLIAYDLRSRKITFTDFYAKPVIVSGDSITYLSKTGKKPTEKNCPNLKEYTANGLGAVIMSEVTVDLLSSAKKETDVFECRATQ